MATKVFTINGKNYKQNCLPDLNDMLGEATKNRFAYNAMKKKYESIIIRSIRRDLRGWKATKVCQLDITWGEKRKGKMRDHDNIIAARKFINDALTESGTIKDDSPKYLQYGRNRVIYTDEPFVRVEIVEIEE